MGDKAPLILDAVSKALPGAAAHWMPLPNSQAALVVVWPGFDNRKTDDRERLVRNSIIAALKVSPSEYFSRIHCHTPTEFQELVRSDIQAFVGEDFTFHIELPQPLRDGEHIEIEWRGPINQEEDRENPMPVYVNGAEPITSTIYNASASVPHGYRPGQYEPTKARVVTSAGQIVAEISGMMKRYLDVSGYAPPSD